VLLSQVSEQSLFFSALVQRGSGEGKGEGKKSTIEELCAWHSSQSAVRMEQALLGEKTRGDGQVKPLITNANAIPKAHSIDLRGRVYSDVEKGASRRAAARRFGVSASRGAFGAADARRDRLSRRVRGDRQATANSHAIGTS
jgi:hypothetical protein